MRKILGRIIGIGAAVCFIAAAIFPESFRYGVDVIAYPWAHSLRGEPTLTGRWRGQVKFDGRASREMTLEIERQPLESHRYATRGKYARHGAFTGWGKMLDEGGNLVRYELFGNANRSGSEVTIRLRSINRQPLPEQQAILQELKGSWKGTTLELAGNCTTALYDGASYKYNDGDPALPVSASLIRQ